MSLNSYGITSRLGIKVTIIGAAALAIAFGVYLLIFEVAASELIYGERLNDYWTKQETAAFEDFQTYVTENELTMQSAIQDVNWKRTHPAMHSYVDRYDPEIETWYTPEEYAEYEIQCSDGVVYAFIYVSADYYFNIARVIALGLAAVCFFLIFLPYVYHVVHRITRLSKEMEVLAGGDLSYKIASVGRDELAELGRDIEGMRRSVLDQMARENASVLANSQLITSLSHDLRTPLTKLTGYLEILQHKKYKDESEHDLYLSKALEKAGQMQSLSDEMFRNFQVKHSNYVDIESQSSAFVPMREVIEILTDQCCDLQDEGFQVTISDSVSPCFVQIHRKDLQRIFDNLFSNLRKYADKEQLISVSVKELHDAVEITLKNYIRVQSSADSTGIGLPTVQSLLSKNGGKMEIDRTDNTFITRLLLNVSK